jgi:uncharacterized protein
MRYLDPVPVITSAGALLREGRQRAGLTQAQLAQRAGVTQSVISAYESGHRQPSVPTLLAILHATGHALDASLIAANRAATGPLSGPLGQRLRQRQRKVKKIAAAHGVHRVRVFGSVARGTERIDSDIDLLMDLPPETGLFALGRLRAELEAVLHAPVDLVPEDGLKPEVRASVAAELVAL